MLGIGRPTKCHFASEWTETLNTIDVIHHTDVWRLICTDCRVCKLDLGNKMALGNETETDILDT